MRSKFMRSKTMQLLAAIEAGDIEKAKKMLEEGAYDPWISLGRRGFAAHVSENIDFDTHDEEDEDEDNEHGLLGHWPLVAAARQGSLEMVKLMMDGSGDAAAAVLWFADGNKILDGAVTSQFQNAFLEALASGSSDIAEEMLPYINWSLTIPDLQWTCEPLTMGAAALTVSAHQKRLAMVKLAISGGAAESLSKNEVEWILVAAIKEPLQPWIGASFSKDLMDELAALVDREDFSAIGEKLVCVAANFGAPIDTVKIILNGIGSTWLAEDREPRRLGESNGLWTAIKKDRPDIIEAILEGCSSLIARQICSSVSYSYDSCLHLAARNCKKIPAILIENFLLIRGDGEEISNYDGNSPVHAAIEAESPANASALAAHFDAQAANSAGNTPLMLLAQKTPLTPEWLSLGLEWAKSQPLVKNGMGVSALEIAIDAGNDDLAVAMAKKADSRDMPRIWRLLFSKSVDSSAEDDSLALRILTERARVDGIDGNIIRNAAKQGDQNFVLAALEAMEDKKAFQSAGGKSGKTPLMIAASKGLVAMAKALLPLSNANDVDRQGRTALMLAMKNKRKKCAKILIPHTDAAMADCQGHTALTHAISSGDEEISKLALSISSVDTMNKELGFQKFTPLSMAVETRMNELVKMLLSAGAIPESGNLSACPQALHSAVDVGNLEAVRILFPMSNPKLLSKRGRSLIMTAALSETLGSPENRAIFELLIPVSDLAARDKFGEGVLDDMNSRSRQLSGERGIAAREMPDFFLQRKQALEESRAIEEAVKDAAPATGRAPRL